MHIDNYYQQPNVISMPNLRKCLRYKLQKSVARFLPRLRICLDCRPLQINENFPQGENYRCLYCQQSYPIQSFIGVNNQQFQTCNPCRVSKNLNFLFKYLLFNRKEPGNNSKYGDKDNRLMIWTLIYKNNRLALVWRLCLMRPGRPWCGGSARWGLVGLGVETLPDEAWLALV